MELGVNAYGSRCAVGADLRVWPDFLSLVMCGILLMIYLCGDYAWWRREHARENQESKVLYGKYIFNIKR
jgi:hypothetical protein